MSAGQFWGIDSLFNDHCAAERRGRRKRAFPTKSPAVIDRRYSGKGEKVV